MHVMVRDKRTGAEDWISLERAAELLRMPPDELEGMLAEYGECESADYVALDQDW
jgi:predicted HTH domain antitoxin